MNLSWMFGGSMAQHHLLWTYLLVWVMQGGYAAWIGWHWLRTKSPQPPAEADSVTREEN